LKLRIGVYPNPLRERGIVFRGLRRVAGESLDDASGCDFKALKHPEVNQAPFPADHPDLLTGGIRILNDLSLSAG
jgi:hypothetical protein